MTTQKTALISVYDKTGIEDFAKELAGLGWKIISSGGTAKVLKDAGLQITELSDITGMPPILDHRVLTLHPKIHGGLLALDTPEHRAELEKYGISWIDLVCSDLYPLEEEVRNPNATKESVIEKTDMGGVALLRSSAKGRRITICEPEQRKEVIEWLKAGEPDAEKFLNDLAAHADALVARYSATSAAYHSGGTFRSIFGEKKLECAYGENAWQKPAALYANLDKNSVDALAIANWQLVAGSPLSYNNICDLDRMMQTVTHIGAGFEKNTGAVPFVAVGAKHGNACGAGIASPEHALRRSHSVLEGQELAGRSEDSSEHAPASLAVEKMLLGDLRAIFGGSVMLNFPVDEKIAGELIHKYAGKEDSQNRRLLDIVAAPSFSAEAVEILSRKKGKCRLLTNENILKAGLASLDGAKRFRYVRGGFMTQPNYTFVPEVKNADVILAWAVGSTSNSNTITLVKDGRLYGNGVGQQDRVGAAKLAIFRADDAAVSSAEQLGNSADGRFQPEAGGKSKNFPVAEHKADLENAVAYSDSFFPFPDAPAALIDRGIKTIFSTSGSVNDEKIVELCKQKGVELILIPDTDARGFYQH